MYFKRVKVLFMGAPYRLSGRKGIGSADAARPQAAENRTTV
jgi:hypothetical protein